ncbi:MAG: 4Fe-4S dicluster domain-containing protein [Desulfobacterales bacterium]
MNRRRFLKLAGCGSVAFAAACSPESPKFLFSPPQASADQVTGRATWYASTCRECPAGCGLIAKNREGRLIKLEGNPLHPLNRGRLCLRGQAALQALYHPDRLTTPLLKEDGRWVPVSRERALALIAARAREAARRGEGRVRLLSEVVGESALALQQAALRAWNSPGPTIFEPYAYEALRAANREVFGVDGLVSYRLDQADFLLSFGAEFLETWLSPVEYAWKFKTMHAVGGGTKGRFLLIAPFQSLTGANADGWYGCRPGAESWVALGLLGRLLALGRGGHLPESLRRGLAAAAQAAPFSTVAPLSGIPVAHLEEIARGLAAAERPLVLGAGMWQSDENGLRVNLAANWLQRVLDPGLTRIDAANRHRAEIAAPRAEVMALFEDLAAGRVDVLFLHQVNPLFHLPPAAQAAEALSRPDTLVVALGPFLDETAEAADLVFPIAHALESWDDFNGWAPVCSSLQPAAGRFSAAPNAGDFWLATAFPEGEKPAPDYRSFIARRLFAQGRLRTAADWPRMLQQGGMFPPPGDPPGAPPESPPDRLPELLRRPPPPPAEGILLAPVPSIRFFDGRGANRPWLCEIPDPLTRVAWQTPVCLHPETARAHGIETADLLRISGPGGGIEAPAYATETVVPGLLVLAVGQGHRAYGRYAEDRGANPLRLLSPRLEPLGGGQAEVPCRVEVRPAGTRVVLARTDGSRIQHGRELVRTVSLGELRRGSKPRKAGLTLRDFPLTLPLPEGYDPKRDFYPPHDHTEIRWGMVVDLDRCIGCAACVAACYAENNIAFVGETAIARGREMAWLEIVRYHDEHRPERVYFLPMLCQHCDNAPCESVCPVYAPHHSAEGLNNQIYNRCIGTRFCSQNCPYKVRRFNWFDWTWPDPLPLQLNPDVTVRSKGVMEKCSFCVQRIKEARTRARNQRRPIREGEVVPACVQTCPTEALVFGNLMDPDSRVRRLCDDPRAYQVLGYLNTKPAVIYLKKVLEEA